MLIRAQAACGSTLNARRRIGGAALTTEGRSQRCGDGIAWVGSSLSEPRHPGDRSCPNYRTESSRDRLTASPTPSPTALGPHPALESHDTRFVMLARAPLRIRNANDMLHSLACCLIALLAECRPGIFASSPQGCVIGLQHSTAADAEAHSNAGYFRRRTWLPATTRAGTITQPQMAQKRTQDCCVSPVASSCTVFISSTTCGSDSGPLGPRRALLSLVSCT
jgi:hypothetical protein